MSKSPEELKSEILKLTREYSKLVHAGNRPGYDESHPFNADGIEGDKLSVPYAGRVFNEDEVEAAVSSTLDFWLTLGKEGDGLSAELAAFLGVKSCVLTNSGSSANLLAVSALTSHKLPRQKRLLPGDEVITCAAGFPTTVAPIIQINCVPVFIDNNPVTGNARVDQLEAAFVEGKTKAVMFAHTLGNPFDLAAVCEFCQKYDLWLIEDNCDALGCTYTLPVDKAKAIGLDHLIKIAEKGQHPTIRIHKDLNLNSGLELLTAPTGTFGDLSTQSFYPPHHLTMGEGGSINIVRRNQLKLLVESFRDWGRDCWCPSGVDNTCGKRFAWQLGELPEGYDHKYIYSHIGYNIKPLDIQAAIGRKQVEKLPAFIKARSRNWEYLRRGLNGLEEFFEFSLPTHATRWIAPGERVQGASSSSSDLTSIFEWEDGSIGPGQSVLNLNSELELTGSRCGPSWFGFMLMVKPGLKFTKSEFAAYLDEKRIGNRMLFGGNLLRQPVFVQLKKDRPDAFRVVGEMTGADRIMNEAIFIGVYPGLTKSQMDYMVETIRNFTA